MDGQTFLEINKKNCLFTINFKASIINQQIQSNNQMKSNTINSSLTNFLSPKRLVTPKNLTKQSSNSSFNKFRQFQQQKMQSLKNNKSRKIETNTQNQEEIEQSNLYKRYYPVTNSIISPKQQKNDRLKNTNINNQKNYRMLSLKHTESEREAPVNNFPEEYKYDDQSDYEKELNISKRGGIRGIKNNQIYSSGDNHFNKYDNFHSSRLEAKQCLQILSRRVGDQIITLNNTIDEFNKRIKNTIQKQYQKFKDLLRGIVEEMFEGNQENIRKLYKDQQRAINQQFSQVYNNLEEMYSKLQKMKEGIQGSQWKKIAGEVLMNDLQKQVDMLVSQSQKLNVYKNVKLQADARRLDAFQDTLKKLLELNLSSTIDTRRTTFLH